jgi:UDP-glucose 4-epimerase
MAARNKPAGIRSLVYGMGKGKVRIEGLSVSQSAAVFKSYIFTYTQSMIPQTWLITGGAGYIGSHVADAFLSDGKEIVIYDSLYQGLESRIHYLRGKHSKEVPLIVGDIRDSSKLDEVLATYNPYGIIHTAALKAVGESMEKPDEYFDVNFNGTTKILGLATSRGIRHFIFSSTAAVYGTPDHTKPILEDGAKNPVSPYGASKLAAESSVEEFLRQPGNFGTSLRFFNVVGAVAPELMDNSVENLVPIVISKLRMGDSPVIYGTDYPTDDGTCIRDYVDVRDIATAHLLTADFKKALPIAINVGTGRGTSVRGIIKLVSGCAGSKNVISIELDRRAGDPANLCADVTLMKRVIGFSPRYSLQESVESLF